MIIMGAIEKNGYIEIQDGVYLSSQESMIEGSKAWGENEHDFDFTTYKYWMTTNSNDTIEGFDTIWEAIKRVEEL